MKLTPLVYVTDMDRGIDFYTKLLPAATIVTSSPSWTELLGGEATRALHYAENGVRSRDGLGLGLDAAAALGDSGAGRRSAGREPSGGVGPPPGGRAGGVRVPAGRGGQG